MAEVTDDLPGMRAVYSQPIEMRINEMIAGIRADLGIKLFGPDLDVLVRPRRRDPGGRLRHPRRRRRDDRAGHRPAGLPGRGRPPRPGPRYGVRARQVTDLVAAAAGLPVGEVLEPDRRFPLVLRLPEADRDDPAALGRFLVPTAAGGRIPLTRLARLEQVEGPSTIQREWGERRIIVQANVRGRDLASFVAEARRRIAEEVDASPRLSRRVRRPVRDI